MIRFDCPHCGKGLRTESEMAGKAFNCPTCRGRVSVPELSSDSSIERRSRGESSGSSGRFKVHSATSRTFGQVLIRPALVAIIATAIAGVALFLFEIPWIVAIPVMAMMAVSGFAIAWLMSKMGRCTKCGSRTVSRSLGVIHRDAPAAKEALEVGDLPALGALSHEGQTIQVAATVCPKCNRNAPIEIQFIPVDAATPQRLLANVVYPGAALPAFERLCQREESGAGVP
jgi:Zn finger protein HypA/HybF involved in hydrogenase expression